MAAQGKEVLPYLSPSRHLVCEKKTHLPAEAARTPSGRTPAPDSQGFSLGSCDSRVTECRAMCGAQRLQSSLHAPTRPAPGRATRHLRGGTWEVVWKSRWFGRESVRLELERR
jgi:hypothetical protein